MLETGVLIRLGHEPMFESGSRPKATSLVRNVCHTLVCVVKWHDGLNLQRSVQIVNIRHKTKCCQYLFGMNKWGLHKLHKFCNKIDPHNWSCRWNLIDFITHYVAALSFNVILIRLENYLSANRAYLIYFPSFLQIWFEAWAVTNEHGARAVSLQIFRDGTSIETWCIKDNNKIIQDNAKWQN